jgi:hypothetical protein
MYQIVLLEQTRFYDCHWFFCGDTSFCRSRWNCRNKSIEILAISPEAVPLNCSNQAAQNERAPDGHFIYEFLNHSFSKNTFNLRLN